MRKLLCTLIVVAGIGIGCASAPAKQRAVISLQSIETALGSLQEFERGTHTSLGLDSVAPDGERRLCPDTALGGLPLPAGASRHQVISCVFAQAFELQRAASVAMNGWNTGQAPPSQFTQLQDEVNVIFGVAKGLPVNPNQQKWLDLAQSTVNTVLSVAKIMTGGAQ